MISLDYLWRRFMLIGLFMLKLFFFCREVDPSRISSCFRRTLRTGRALVTNWSRPTIRTLLHGESRRSRRCGARTSAGRPIRFGPTAVKVSDPDATLRTMCWIRIRPLSPDLSLSMTSHIFPIQGNITTENRWNEMEEPKQWNNELNEMIYILLNHFQFRL